MCPGMNGFRDSGAGNGESRKLTQLWRDLYAAGKWVSESSPLMTHCQAELWELMRQIDIMVDNKKNEWKAASEKMQLHLQAKERECLNEKAVTDQKTREAAQLRVQLAQTERDHKEAIVDYTKQAAKLRDEVGRLRKHYEKMKSRYSQEKAKMSHELEGSLVELHRLQRELEDQKRHSDGLESLRRTLQGELDSSEVQRKSLSNKCDLLQQQAASQLAQSQKRRQQLAEVEDGLRSDVKRLTAELNVASGVIAGQKAEMDKLRSTELALRSKLHQSERERASLQFEEKQTLAATVQRLEAEVRSLTSELKVQGSPARRALADVSNSSNSSSNQEREIARLEGYLQEKDIMIKELIQKSQMLNVDPAVVESLRDNLERSEERNRKLSEREADWRLEAVRLRADLDDLRRRLEAGDAECSTLREQLREKVQELRHTELRDLKERDMELTQVRKQMVSAADHHAVEVAELRDEVERLERQLSEKDRMLNQSPSSCNSSSSDRRLLPTFAATNFALLEERLRVAEATADNHAATLKVANSQLDALRLENKLLKEHVVKLSQSNLDKLEAESHLRELQRLLVLRQRPRSSDDGDHNRSAVARLEKENESLKFNLAQLRSKMQMRGNSDFLQHSAGSEEQVSPQVTRTHSQQSQSPSGQEVLSGGTAPTSMRTQSPRGTEVTSRDKKSPSLILVDQRNSPRPIVLTADYHVRGQADPKPSILPTANGRSGSNTPDQKAAEREHQCTPIAQGADGRQMLLAPEEDCMSLSQSSTQLPDLWRTPPAKQGVESSAERHHGAREVDSRTRNWLLERAAIAVVTPEERGILLRQIDKTRRRLESANSSFSSLGRDDSIVTESTEKPSLCPASPHSQSELDSLSHTLNLSEDPGDRPESASTRFLQDRQQRSMDLERLIDHHLKDLRVNTDREIV